MTRTFWPASTIPTSRSPWSAVSAAIGSAAASSNDTDAGLGAIRIDLAAACSAHEPAAVPKTDRLDDTCEVGADTRVLGTEQLSAEKPDEGRSEDFVPLQRVDGCGPHLHQDLVVVHGRRRDVSEVDGIELLMDDCLHLRLLSCAASVPYDRAMTYVVSILDLHCK